MAFFEQYNVIIFGIFIPNLIQFPNEILCIVTIKISSPPKPRISTHQFTYKKNEGVRNSTLKNLFRETFPHDKRAGCQIPGRDYSGEDLSHLGESNSRVVCLGMNWVRCQLSQCKVKKVIHKMYNRIECVYRDLIYDSDENAHLGKEVKVAGNEIYTLVRSDHAKVTCIGQKQNETGLMLSFWLGYVIGFRKKTTNNPLHGRGNTFNVLIFGFDSASRNDFLRLMPLSRKVLNEDLHAVILNGYNNVGDGTRKALFPILTGRDESELHNVKTGPKKVPMDRLPWIFYDLKKYGYRTAYFEDSPATGIFKHHRLNGWMKQPTDHYSRHYFLKLNELKKSDSYCIGDVPYYAKIMKITKDFFQLAGNKFCFTFIVNITHNVNHKITEADEYMAAFLKKFKKSGQLNDTLLILLSGHGPRFRRERSTFSNYLEERHPFMAIILPENLRTERPEAYWALMGNKNELTIPHDIYATIIDVIYMRGSWNLHRVRGADQTRGLSLLNPISGNRSCSEAGVGFDFCTCFNWNEISRLDPMFNKSAEAVLMHINDMVSNHTTCMARSLITIDYVLKKEVYDPLLKVYNDKARPTSTTSKSEDYIVMITIGPGRGKYEATLTYYRKDNSFAINTRDIQRANAFDHNNETACIRNVYPHLRLICYCRDYFKRTEENNIENSYYFSFYTTPENDDYMVTRRPFYFMHGLSIP